MVQPRKTRTRTEVSSSDDSIDASFTDSLLADEFRNEEAPKASSPLKESREDATTESSAKRKLIMEKTEEPKDNVATCSLIDEATDEDDTPLTGLKQKALLGYQSKKQKAQPQQPSSSVLVPTPGVDPNIEGKFPTPDGETPSQCMTRAQAADALAELSKSKPRVMRRKEVAVKNSSKSKKTSTSSARGHSRLAKGKAVAKTFKDSDAEAHWHRIIARNFMPECCVKNKSGPMKEVLKLLDEVGLLKSVLDVKPFVKNVVLEFYANMSKEMFDTSSPDAFLSYVRGHLFAFSPHEINRFLNHSPTAESMESLDMDVVVNELTQGKVTSLAILLFVFPSTSSQIQPSLSPQTSDVAVAGAGN